MRRKRQQILLFLNILLFLTLSLKTFGSREPPPPWPPILSKFRKKPDTQSVTSKLANIAEMETSWCSSYLNDMNELPNRKHRKQWEFCWIAHALDHFKKLHEESKGLGFAVGKEPLASYFVKRGTSVTISDLPIEKETGGWSETGQHAAELEATYRNGVVDYDSYKRKAKFIPVDMNHIPVDMLQGEYDFLWSSSSLEHVGKIELGKKFIVNSMRALKVGGIAVHTTEFCINSENYAGRDEIMHMQVWLKKDVDDLSRSLEDAGCKLYPVQYALGRSKENLRVDEEPYRASNHMNLVVASNVVHTSIGLIIERTK